MSVPPQNGTTIELQLELLALAMRESPNVYLLDTTSEPLLYEVLQMYTNGKAVVNVMDFTPVLSIIVDCAYSICAPAKHET